MSCVTRLIGVSFLATSLCAFGTDLADLPIGHLKIVEGERDTFGVEARCASAMDLLRSIADRTDKPIVFDNPCFTYVSIPGRTRLMKPEEWLDLIACTASEGSLTVRQEACSWRVSGTAEAKYDPSLDDASIIDAFSKESFQANTPKTGLEGGVILYDGHLIAGPYSIEQRTETVDRAAVYVNDVKVMTLSRLPCARQFSKEMPASGQFSSIDDLVTFINVAEFPRLIEEGLTPLQALQKLADFLKGQNLVVAVELDTNLEPYVKHPFGQGPLKARFKGLERVLIPVLAHGCNLTTGKSPAFQADKLPANSPAERAKQEADLLRRCIEKKELILLSRIGGTVMLQRGTVLSSFLARLDLAHQLPLLQAECIIDEVIEDRAIARSVAAGLSSDYHAIRDAVVRLEKCEH